MKKYLLAGTSAVALALTAGAANAQSAPGKFDVKISGDAYFEGGYIKQTENQNTAGITGAGSQTNGDFTNRFRLTVNPEAKADNGLVYGANVRIRANGGAGTVDGDRAYIYFTGAFGSLQAGVTAGPSDNTYVAYPMDWQMLGIYDAWRGYMPTTGATAANATTVSTTGSMVAGAAGTGAMAWGQFGTGSATTVGTVASEGVQLLHSHDIDTKLVYYTPRFGGSKPETGLQGAISYTPHVGAAAAGDGGVSVNTGVSRSTTTGVAACSADSGLLQAASCQQKTAFRDVYELTANYKENFGGLMIKGSIGYEGGKAMSGAAADNVGALGFYKYQDLKSIQAGLQVGFQDLVVGGGYVNNFNSGYRKQDSAQVKDYVSDMTSWNVGAQYTFGPAVVGVKYMQQNDPGDLTIAGGRRLDTYGVGGMYTVAPGLRTGLEYTYFKAKSDISMNQSNTVDGSKKQSGNVILLRGVVSF